MVEYYCKFLFPYFSNSKHDHDITKTCFISGLLHGVTIAACATCSAAPDWMEMIWLLCSTEDPAFMVSLSWFSYRLDH